MATMQKFDIIQHFLTTPSKRRSGRLLRVPPVFIVAHDTGNPGSTALGNVRYYENSRDEISASAHIFVDDRQIIECIPALTVDKPEKAWHVLYDVETDNGLFGCNANDAAIGVEYCYGGTINADEAYRRYVWVLAYACAKFHINPATNIIGHCFLDPARKTDPVTGLLRSRRSTYEQLKNDVVAEHKEITGVPQPMDSNFVPQLGRTVTTVRLNLRTGPGTRFPAIKILPAGQAVQYVGFELNGEALNSNGKWFKMSDGSWLWSGGVDPS